MEPLDNPVWHALEGPHRHLADHHGDAARYQPDVTPFAALPDEPTPKAWEALAELVGPRGYPVLFRDVIDKPAGWEVVARFPALQMVPTPRLHEPTGDPPIEPLSTDDVPAMLALVERTLPGPFLPRTIDLGGYIGIRVRDRLVAMGGQRMRVAGHTEISAVCTDPDERGKGLARALVGELARAIRQEGDEPFLHVLTENRPAIQLYERLGFTARREIDAAVLRRVE